jgi:hypothetical protein
VSMTQRQICGWLPQTHKQKLGGVYSILTADIVRNRRLVDFGVYVTGVFGVLTPMSWWRKPLGALN